MSTVRRATPDSEAVASSEDERPWPSSTAFGTLPRKDTAVPGLPGIWSTQNRGSFKMGEAAKRIAIRDVRLGAPNPPHSGLRATPSPAASSEGAGQLPFPIPLQPTPKVMRSLSHSQGQREVMQNAGTQPGAADHALPLGLLAEEDADLDEIDSEFGAQLTHTTSHPPIGSLQRTGTLPAAYEQAVLGYSNGLDDYGVVSPGGRRRLEAAFAGLTIEQPYRRPAQWQSHLGWDDLPVPNESRRHSLADIPTRRGSLDLDHPIDNLGNGVGNGRLDRAWDGSGQAGSGVYGHPLGTASHSSTTSSLSHTHTNTAINTADMRNYETGIDIPDMYRVPYVAIPEDDHSTDGRRRLRGSNHANPLSTNVFSGGAPARPRKQLFIVSFKCSRVDVFYILMNTGLTVREGDIVIVEADRGQDLGTVQHADITSEQARLYKKKYSEEQYKWLMMFSRNNAQGNVNPNAQPSLLTNAPPSVSVTGMTRDSSLKPKAIKRLASPHEVRMLGEKEGNEAKAKRTCQQKVANLRLEMEILDAEFQWDFQKVIFYYYADKYINFKDLITELYRIYKSRIWLSAVNPASFSQQAMGQPPSGIGPGAITDSDGGSASYSPTYVADPDPYGAVPPYRIDYATYTPNYPGIPGVTNSFAPGSEQEQRLQIHESPYPAVAPGTATVQPGHPSNYHFFYDRSGTNEHLPPHARPVVNGGFPYYGAMPADFTPLNPAVTTPQNAIGFGREFPRPIGSARQTSNHNSQLSWRQQANDTPVAPLNAAQDDWLKQAHRIRTNGQRDAELEARVQAQMRDVMRTREQMEEGANGSGSDNIRSGFGNEMFRER